MFLCCVTYILQVFAKVILVSEIVERIVGWGKWVAVCV